MMSTLTIVMYHYVRNLKQSRYPGIKGLDLKLFREQLDYLQRHYVLMRPEEVIAAVTDKGSNLPANSALLTFDDGYLDHFTNVFPILLDRNLSGMFFPTVQTVVRRRLLNINKIHFVLASVDDPKVLVQLILESIEEFNDDYQLVSGESLYAEHAKQTRFDHPDVLFVKRMTQFVLPIELRTIISDRMFERFVSIDETAFAEELYVGPEQLKTMASCGMYIGSHSATHPWLNTLPTEQQEREIDDSLAMLADLGAPVDDWVMCYPSGASNDSLLNILRERRCAIGLTTKPDIANLKKDNPLLLPRLDTNDLPKNAGVGPNDWTQRVL